MGENYFAWFHMASNVICHHVLPYRFSVLFFLIIHRILHFMCLFQTWLFDLSVKFKGRM